MEKSVERIENEYVSLWIEDGIIHEAFKKGVTKVTLSMAEIIVRDRLRLSDGIIRPIIIFSNDVKSMDKGARDFFSSEEGIRYLSASAILVDNYITLITSRLLLSFNKPPFSVEIFKSYSRALEWLSYYKNLN